MDLAFKEGIITEHDRERIRAADEARDEAIQVDAFEPETYRSIRR
jgi:hypothetical protein